MNHHISSLIEEFTEEGSGWKLRAILKFGIVKAKYQFAKIGTYFPTPFPLTEYPKALLNIDNSVPSVNNALNKCFLLSVLSRDKIGGLPAVRNNNRAHYDKKVSTYIPSMKTQTEVEKKREERITDVNRNNMKAGDERQERLN